MSWDTDQAKALAAREGRLGQRVEGITAACQERDRIKAAIDRSIEAHGPRQSNGRDLLYARHRKADRRALNLALDLYDDLSMLIARERLDEWKARGIPDHMTWRDVASAVGPASRTLAVRAMTNAGIEMRPG